MNSPQSKDSGNKQEAWELESRSSESRLTQEDLSALIGGEENETNQGEQSADGNLDMGISDSLMIPENTSLLSGLPITVTVVLGKKRIPIHDLTKMRTGDIVELGSKVGEYMDIMVGNKTYAQGKLVAIDGEYLGIKFIQIYGISNLPPSNF